MSETLPPEYIDQLKSRDSRFAVLAQAIAIENDLRDNQTIRSLMDAIRQDAEQAMRDVVQVSPADLALIAHHQVRIRTLVYVRDVLDTILRRGALAEQELRAEDYDG